MGLAAVIGVGAVASVAGGVISGNAQKNAANKAADTSMAVAQENSALAREIYGENKSALSPYMERGNAAGGAINALLGLAPPVAATPATPTTPTPTTPTAPPPAFVGQQLDIDHELSPQRAWSNYGNLQHPDGVDWQKYIDSQSDVAYDYQLQGQGMTPEQFGQWHWQRDGARRNLSPYTTPVAPTPAPTPIDPATPAPTGTPALTAQQQAQAAFDTYKSSTGYEFRVAQGNKALNSGWAGSGSLKSGAAGKAFMDYGQNIASGEFSNYMGLLANQQGVGLSGASALAGVGQNYVNNVSANNNSAGTAAANAILANGANNPFGNALSTLGGAAFQYGLGR